MSVQNQHQKPLHPLSHQYKEIGVRREKEPLEVGVRLGRSIDSHAKTMKGICTKLPCDKWHPPECQFYKSESGCKFGNKCSFPHRKVEEDTEPPESLSISLKGTKVLGRVRRVRFTKATQRHADIRENKGPSLHKIQVKLPHQRSPHAMKFEDRSQEEIKRQERCARGDAWRLEKNIF